MLFHGTWQDYAFRRTGDGRGLLPKGISKNVLAIQLSIYAGRRVIQPRGATFLPSPSRGRSAYARNLVRRDCDQLDSSERCTPDIHDVSPEVHSSLVPVQLTGEPLPLNGTISRSAPTFSFLGWRNISTCFSHSRLVALHPSSDAGSGTSTSRGSRGSCAS